MKANNPNNYKDFKHIYVAREVKELLGSMITKNEMWSDAILKMLRYIQKNKNDFEKFH